MSGALHCVHPAGPTHHDSSESGDVVLTAGSPNRHLTRIQGNCSGNLCAGGDQVYLVHPIIPEPDPAPHAEEAQSEHLGV